jgi:NADPH:quinone reductase-like Zn-dependent oxidoreductase
MKVLEARSTKFSDLTLAERPVPTPNAGEILIRVKAASINYRDIVLVKGLYKPDIEFPFVPLSDGSGDVVAMGEGVTRFRVGDAVVPVFIQGWPSGLPIPERRANWTTGWPRTGMLQEYIVVPADDAVLKPANLTHAEASTLPIAALTAWSALTQGRIQAGDWVLVEGTGGVSIFALQFAKVFGARVVVITSSDEKIARVRALGADTAINYKTTPDWAPAVRAATGGRGVDIVVETAGSTLPQALKSLAFGGYVGVVGFLGGFETQLPIMPLIESLLRIEGIAVGSRQQFENMNRAIEANGIKPVIDRTLPLDGAADGFELMERGGHFGKVVIEI